MWNFALDCPGHLLGQKFCVTRLAVCVLFAVAVAVVFVAVAIAVNNNNNELSSKLFYNINKKLFANCKEL